MSTVDVHQLSAELLDRAARGSAHRAASTLPHPVDGLRQTLIALLAGAELGEHESPGPASLLVLRGRVRLVKAAPEPGTLGGWPEAVVVSLGQGGAVTVLASAVIAWIRHRTSTVTCTVTRPDGTSVQLAATRVRSADLARVRELVEQVAAALGDTDGNREIG